MKNIRTKVNKPSKKFVSNARVEQMTFVFALSVFPFAPAANFHFDARDFVFSFFYLAQILPHVCLGKKSLNVVVALVLRDV